MGTPPTLLMVHGTISGGSVRARSGANVLHSAAAAAAAASVCDVSEQSSRRRCDTDNLIDMTPLYRPI